MCNNSSDSNGDSGSFDGDYAGAGNGGTSASNSEDSFDTTGWGATATVESTKGDARYSSGIAQSYIRRGGK